MQNHTVSGRLADFVSELTYDHLQPSQILLLKTFFLDWLASGIAGRNETPVAIMDALIMDMGGKPESTVFTGPVKVPCLWAALINGASSHIREMDDLHRASILHPAAAVLPAVFACAERVHANGKDMITAIAAGYEVGIRIALTSGPAHYRHWHTTGTCGTFGAASGSASILGLKPDEISWALGSAGTQASGLWEFLTDNAMSKQLHAGKAAFNGLLSALLAGGGFTGAHHILEGNKGFFAATSAEHPAHACLDDLGKHFLFEKNSLKYYASCGHTHAAIEATVKALSPCPCPPEDIDRITVSTYQSALDLLGTVRPETPFAAKFNLPFCIALAVKFGRAGIDDFCDQNLHDPELLGLMDRIHVAGDAQIGSEYPEKWPARVEIRTRTGSIFMGRVDYPRGDPENPMSMDELMEKYDQLTSGLMGKSEARRLADRVMNLESVSDMADLFTSLDGH